MNLIFTNEIFQILKAFFMQSRSGESTVEIEASAGQNQPKSFEFYEEYSQRSMAETIRTRKDMYENASPQIKEELQTEVEIEVENFQIWLEAAKNLEPIAAHYYSVSLKCLLLGLPIGMQVARLFSIVLDGKDLGID